MSGPSYNRTSARVHEERANLLSPDTEIPVQTRIEEAMKDSFREERWESIFLFSGDGLLMAGQGSSPDYYEEKLLEFSFSLMEGLKRLDRHIPMMEIRLKGKRGRTLVFRYFEAWGEELVLAAVVSGRKGYKRALSGLIRLIRELG